MLTDVVSGPPHPTVRSVRCQSSEIFLSAIMLPALSRARAVTELVTHELGVDHRGL